MILECSYRKFSILVALIACVSALPGHCPRKFIQVIDTYGRLNNNIYAFKNALWLAVRTNRTVVVSDTDPYIAELDQIFDMEALASGTGWCIVPKHSALLSAPGLTSEILPGTPAYGKSLYDFIVMKPEVDVLKFYAPYALFAYFYNTADNVGPGACESSTVPRCDYREFRGTEFDKKFDALFYGNFDFKPIFHKFAESYQHQYLSDKFVAVHLRSFGGNCHWPHFFQWMLNNANIRALDSCNINTKLVDEILRLSGHDTKLFNAAHKNLFMATDFEEHGTDDDFKQRGFIGYKMTTDAAEFSRTFKGFDVIMDMVMMFRSELFIGTEHSTLAKLIGGMRRMRGRRSLLAWPPVD